MFSTLQAVFKDQKVCPEYKNDDVKGGYRPLKPSALKNHETEVTRSNRSKQLALRH